MNESTEWRIIFFFFQSRCDESLRVDRLHLWGVRSCCGEGSRENTGWVNDGRRFFLSEERQTAHKPCLARAAVTSCASVESWGDSRRLMLPAEDSRGEVPPVSTPGVWVTTISAPWSTRALADSRKDSLWLSIWRRKTFGSGSQRLFMLRIVNVCVRVSFFYHDVPASGGVAGVAQGADFGVRLVLKVQLHVLNTHMTSSWGQDSEEREKSKPEGISCLQEGLLLYLVTIL